MARAAHDSVTDTLNTSLVWPLVGFASLAIMVMATMLLNQERKDVIALGSSRAESLSQVAATYIDQTLSEINIGMDGLDADPTQPGIIHTFDFATVDAILARVGRSVDTLNSIAVLDSDGNLVADRNAAGASAVTGEPLNFSDRRYFQYHARNATDMLRIGAPLLARPQGNLGIPVTRRLDTETGDFAGVVLGLISPGKLHNFFASLDVGAAALVRADGTLLARYPETDLLAAPQLDFVVRHAGADGLVIDQLSPIDGMERLVALRQVGELPLYMAVGFDREVLLSVWYSKRNVGIALVLMTILTLTGGAYLMRKRMTDAIAVEYLKAKAQREIAARRHADDVSRAKSDFLSHMSHELRTPLNAILGFSEILKDQVFGPIGQPQYRDYADDIHFSAVHLLSVINNILDLSKVEAGHWQLNDEDIPLGALLRDLVRLCASRALRERVTIRVAPLPGDVLIRGDRRSLLQILLNITVNAIKFAGPTGMIDIQAEGDADGWLQIAVIDHGEGMDAADLARVMQPYETSASQIARRGQDTGLGLPLATVFAEMHGGKLVIDSAPGQGTTARLRLPPDRVKPVA